MPRSTLDTAVTVLPPSPLQGLLDLLDRKRLWVFIAIGLFYAAGFNGLHRIGDDSSLYLAIGQNIAAGEGYTYRGEPATRAMPLVPYVLGICLKASPDSGVAIALGVLLVSGLGMFALAYQLLLRLVPRRTAVLALIFLAVNNQVYGVHFRLLTDAPYLLGLIATFLGFEWLTHGRTARGAGDTPESLRSRGLSWLLFLSGLTVATTSRIVMLGLLMALGVACLWGCISRPRRVTQYLIAAGTLVVFAAFYLMDPRRSGAGAAGVPGPTYEAGLWRRVVGLGETLQRTLNEFIPVLMDPVAVEGTFGIDPSPLIAWVFSTIALGLGVIGCGKRPLWLAFFASNIGMMLFFGSAPRYFIPVALMVHLGGAVVVVWLAKRDGRLAWVPVAAGMTLALVTFIPNFATSIGFILEQRAPDFYVAYKDGKYAHLPQAAQALDEQLPQDAKLLSQRARTLTCYAGRDVYSAADLTKRMGGVQGLEDLMARGELFVLLPAGAPMDELLASPGVQVGPRLGTVPHWGVDEPSLTLHRVTYTAPEGRSGP